MKRSIWKSSLLMSTVVLVLIFASCNLQGCPDDFESDPTVPADDTDGSDDPDDPDASEDPADPDPAPINHAPAASFSVGDYEVTGAGTTLVNGIYEETGTLNTHPLYTQTEGGSYKLFFANFSGHDFPPPEGDYWCIDTDENTVSLLDLEYWKYGTVALPPESGWSAQTGTDPAPEFAPIGDFSGSTALYGTLTAIYTFSDPDGDTEGTSLYRWLRYNPAVGDDPGTLIDGADGVSYTTTDDDNGMYLKIEVTPVDDKEFSGTAVLSKSSGTIGG